MTNYNNINILDKAKGLSQCLEILEAELNNYDHNPTDARDVGNTYIQAFVSIEADLRGIERSEMTQHDLFQENSSMETLIKHLRGSFYAYQSTDPESAVSRLKELLAENILAAVENYQLQQDELVDELGEWEQMFKSYKKKRGILALIRQEKVEQGAIS